MKRVLHWALRLLPRLVGPLIVLIPLFVLIVQGFDALLRRADALLAQAAPIVSAELSAYLRRPVRIGRITPRLSARGLYDIVTHPETYGTLPIEAGDVVIETVDRERTYAGSDVLAKARRLVLYVSPTKLLAGQIQEAVPRILIESPEAVLVRDPRGRFNVLDLLPERPEPEKPPPPFRTVVEVTDAHGIFRDYASAFPDTADPAVNEIFSPRTVVDLSGTRTIEVSTRARAWPGSATASRLKGSLSVLAGIRRGRPGETPDGPPVGAPVLTLQGSVRDADVRYWLNYLVRKVPIVRLERARADADIALVLPDAPTGRVAPLSLSVNAAFRDADARFTFLPIPFRESFGTLQLADGILLFSVRSKWFEQGVAATGSVRNLPPIGVPATSDSPPIFQATVNAPGVPVKRLVAAVLPRGQSLPPELRLGDRLASAQFTVTGAATGKLTDIAVVGSLGGVDADWRGLPGVRDVAANVTFSGGVLQLKQVNATAVGGGRLSGDGVVRLVGERTAVGNAAFAVRAEGVDLAGLDLLAPLRKGDPRTRIRGIGQVEAAGRRINGQLTAAANLSTKNLFVGSIAIPVARARVTVAENRVTIPYARLESAVGVAAVNGRTSPDGALDLRFRLASLDLRALGQAIGIDTISGTLSGAGSVRGTFRQPQVRLDDLLAMNLRLFLRGATESAPVRRLALDLARTGNVDISAKRLRLNRPLELYRFPASVRVTGEVLNLLPDRPKAPINPRFNLIANIANLSYEEVQRQLAEVPLEAARRIARQQGVIRRRVRTDPEEREPPIVSGSIARSVVQVGGTLSDPKIRGSAELGTLVVGTYPITSGSLTFEYDKRRTVLRNAEVTGTIGTLSARAVLTARGELSGSFRAPGLNIEKLSYLTDGLLQFAGNVDLAGTFSGTLSQPIITASLAAPRLTLAGTEYQEVVANNLRFVGGEKGQGATITLPEFTFVRRRGDGAAGENTGEDTVVRLADVRYAPESGEVGAVLQIRDGDLRTVFEIIRRSGLDQTEQGARIVRALTNLPDPTDARFDIRRLAVRGRITDAGFLEPAIDADIEMRDLQFGQFGNTPEERRKTTLNLEGTLRGEVVNISRFEVRRPEATIRGGGTYDPDGQVDAFLESNGASLDIIRSLPGLGGFPVRGVIDFALSARGESRNPRIFASVEGRDLLVTTGTAAGSPGVPRIVNGREEYELPISLFRIEADLVQSNPGQYNVVISDAIVTATDDLRLTASALIPVALNEDASVARRPFRFNLKTLSNRGETIELKRLADYLAGKTVPPAAPDAAPTPGGAVATVPAATATPAAKGTAPPPEERSPVQLEGTLTADIAYGGTLESPALSGQVIVEDGRFRLASEGRRERLSPITDFAATLRLAGNSILFDRFRVKLGGENEPGNEMTLSGAVQLKSLSDLERVLRRPTPGTAGTPPSVTAAAFDLALNFDRFRPVTDNLFGLGEAFKGQFDGTLRLTGDLKDPVLRTASGSPLRLSRTEVRLPTINREPEQGTPPPPVNPTFDVAIDLAGTSVLASPPLFRFEVQSDRPVRISGRLFPRPGQTTSDFAVNAEVTPQGGYFNLQGGYLNLARFNVQRQGKVTVAFGGTNPRVLTEDVRATAKIYRPRGGGLFGGSRTALVSGTDATTPVNRYTVTATLNGPLDLFETENGVRNGDLTRSSGIDLTSDPPLSESEIIALIGGRSALELAQQGRVETAFRDLLNQTLYSGYLPGLVSQVTGNVAQTLGLEDLTIDYNTDEPIRVRFVKRLPDPFNRFIVDYTRAFQQRNAPTQLTPYVFSFSYELYQFNTSYRLLPRLQLGFQTDEQRNFIYFLRGTVSY